MAAYSIHTNSRFEKLFKYVNKNDPKRELKVIAQIGSGTYGDVYKAFRYSDHLETAIKVVRLDPKDDSLSILREIQTLRECRHQNIVRYYDSYIRHNKLWICMEYCGGSSIQDIYSCTRTPLEEDCIAFICREALRGLEYMHKRRQVHRDIKGANILLTERGEVKLADFGVAAKMSHAVQKRNSFIGTPYWMAPEVCAVEKKGGYDEKCDCWSIGITAIECAELQPPFFDLPPMKALTLIASRNFKPPSLHSKTKWTSRFHNFVKVCLTKNERKRPSSEQLLLTEFVSQLQLNEMLTLRIINHSRLIRNLPTLPYVSKAMASSSNLSVAVHVPRSGKKKSVDNLMNGFVLPLEESMAVGVLLRSKSQGDTHFIPPLSITDPIHVNDDDIEMEENDVFIGDDNNVIYKNGTLVNQKNDESTKDSSSSAPPLPPRLSNARRNSQQEDISPTATTTTTTTTSTTTHIIPPRPMRMDSAPVEEKVTHQKQASSQKQYISSSKHTPMYRSSAAVVMPVSSRARHRRSDALKSSPSERYHLYKLSMSQEDLSSSHRLLQDDQSLHSDNSIVNYLLKEPPPPQQPSLSSSQHQQQHQQQQQQQATQVHSSQAFVTSSAPAPSPQTTNRRTSVDDQLVNWQPPRVTSSFSVNPCSRRPSAVIASNANNNHNNNNNNHSKSHQRPESMYINKNSSSSSSQNQAGVSRHNSQSVLSSSKPSIARCLFPPSFTCQVPSSGSRQQRHNNNDDYDNDTDYRSNMKNKRNNSAILSPTSDSHSNSFLDDLSGDSQSQSRSSASGKTNHHLESPSLLLSNHSTTHSTNTAAMRAGFSLIFEGFHKKIHSTATWLDPSSTGQVILFATNEGIYSLDLSQTQEAQMELLIPRRCIWLYVVHNTLVSLSGKHPQLYLHNLTTLLRMPRAQRYSLHPHKLKNITKLVPKRFSASSVIHDTRGCRKVNITRNPYSGQKYLCAALTNHILLMEWSQPSASFLEVRRVFVPHMPNPLLTFDALVTRDETYPLVCLGVYKTDESDVYRLFTVNMNNAESSSSAVASSPVVAAATSPLPVAVVCPDEEMNLNEGDLLPVIKVTQLEYNAVLVCFQDCARVLSLDGRLKASRSLSSEIQFSVSVDGVACLRDSVLAFHQHGLIGKNFLSEVTHELYDERHIYALLGHDRNIVIESRPSDDPMSSCNIYLFAGVQ